MKQFLWIVLGTIGFINHSLAGASTSDLGVHFSNKTSSTIYLTSKYTKNAKSCKHNLLNFVTVKPGGKYKFSIMHKRSTYTACHISLLGYTDPNFSESTIALQERFQVEIKNSLDGEHPGSYVSSHETPPSKCGLGMTCSTSLTNRRTSLYIKTTNKDNQYAHIVLNNNKQEVYYAKFNHLNGKCISYLKNNSWFKIMPESTETVYILNPNKDKTCTYEVSITNDSSIYQSKTMVCNAILKIYDDFNNNTIISSTFNTYNCDIVLNKNRWLANVILLN